MKIKTKKNVYNRLDLRKSLKKKTDILVSLFSTCTGKSVPMIFSREFCLSSTFSLTFIDRMKKKNSITADYNAENGKFLTFEISKISIDSKKILNAE